MLLFASNICENVSSIIKRYKNKINNPIKIWWTIIIENKLHVIKIAKGIIKDRHIEGYISLHTQPCSIVLLNPKREHTNKIFFSLMTCDITSMYSKYVLGKLQICNLVRFIILYIFYGIWKKNHVFE